MCVYLLVFKNSDLVDMIYILLGVCQRVAKITHTLMNTLVIAHERWGELKVVLSQEVWYISVTYICCEYNLHYNLQYKCDIYLDLLQTRPLFQLWLELISS